MRHQGPHLVRRAFSRAACTAIVVAMVLSPVSAMAQTADPDDLGAIILSGVLTGFRKAAPPAYNGPMDAQALSDMTGGEASASDFAGIHAYAKTWINKKNDVVLAFLYRFVDVNAAGRFYVEYAAGTHENASRTTTLRELPRAFSYIDEDGASFGVVQHRGRYMSVIHVDSERRGYKIADAIALAEKQAARFPVEATPQTPVVEEDAAAANAGIMFAVALPCILLGAFLGARGARKHRTGLTAPSQSAWPPPPPPPADQAMPVETPAPFVAPAPTARRRSRILVTLLTVSGALGVATCVSSIMQAVLIQGAADGRAITSAQAAANDGRQALIAVITLAVFGVTVVAWCLWQYRAHANLTRLEARNDLLFFTPGWAVGWWFVPFANLVRPYQAMTELADSSTRPDDAATRISLGRLTGWWWGLFVGAGVLATLARGLDDDIDGLVEASYAGAALGLVRAATAVLAVVLVIRIQRLQNGRTFDSPPPGAPASLPVPPPPPAADAEPAQVTATAATEVAVPEAEPAKAKPRRPRAAPKAGATAKAGTAKPRTPRTPRPKENLGSSAAPSATR